MSFSLRDASYSICSGHCRIHSASLHCILFQSSRTKYETITRYNIHNVFNSPYFICSSGARSHGSLFCLFFPPYLGGGTECFDRAVCGLVRARSCDTGVTSMGRRTDARFCLIGSAHFPSLAQNGENKRGYGRPL